MGILIFELFVSSAIFRNFSSNVRKMNNLTCVVLALIAFTCSCNGFAINTHQIKQAESLQNIISRTKRSIPEGGSNLIALIDGMFLSADEDNNQGLDSEEFWKTFKKFDSDDDEVITLREYVVYFNQVMGSQLRGIPIGPTSAILFSAGDMDGNNLITKDEDAEVIFLNLDQDGDEFISKAEYFSRWEEVLRRINLRTQARGRAPKVEEV